MPIMYILHRNMSSETNIYFNQMQFHIFPYKHWLLLLSLVGRKRLNTCLVKG